MYQNQQKTEKERMQSLQFKMTLYILFMDDPANISNLIAAHSRNSQTLFLLVKKKKKRRRQDDKTKPIYHIFFLHLCYFNWEKKLKNTVIGATINYNLVK